jgi:hypothetical protein
MPLTRVTRGFTVEAGTTVDAVAMAATRRGPGAEAGSSASRPLTRTVRREVACTITGRSALSGQTPVIPDLPAGIVRLFRGRTGRSARTCI